MSAKDSMAKEYFADNARFADLCNNILYGGREVILPENLKERDTTEVLTALGLDKKTIAMQKMRDIFKNASIKYTGKSYVVLIGVENQSDIHYAIPVKNMFYDVMAYGNQVKETAKKHRKEKDTATSDEFLSGFTKEDKLIPVITITVYLGTKEWDGPRKLSDMFGDVDEELLPSIPDYRINLLAPREITDFTGFRTSIRQLFEVLKNAYDKEKMQEVLQNDEKFSKVDRETVEAINLFAGTDIDIDGKEEVIDMCKAWEDQKNEGRELGREEGREEGREHQLFIDEWELKNSSLNGKYQVKDFVWHMEVESVSSTGATEHKGDISFRMGDDGKLIYGPEGNGEPDGIFKFSSNEIAGETGAQGKPDDPKYKNYLNYYILGYNKEMHITLGNDFLTGEKLNISVWLGLEDMPEFKSNTITFYTY